MGSSSLATETSPLATVPLGPTLSLAPHRLLQLKNGSLAILAEKNTGWCIVKGADYQAIRAGLEGGCQISGATQSGTRDVLESLWKNGLLLADRQPNPATVVETDRYPRSLLLKLTGACNLECTYCYDYDRQRWKARLQWERIVETLRFLLSKRDALSLVFHGGEPLLRFDLIRQIVREARAIAGEGKTLSFAIQTNGTLFTDEIVDFLRAHRFSVGISLDGSDERSNSLRKLPGGKGSLPRVLALIERYGSFIREQCGFLAVVSNTSVAGLPEFALWLQDRGIQSLTITSLDLEGRAREIPEEKLRPEAAVRLHQEILAMVRSGEIDRLCLRSLISRMNNLFTFRPADFCHKGPCAAAGEFLVLDAEGAFRTCDCIYHPYFELAKPDQPVETIVDHPARAAIRERHEWLRLSGADCRTCPLFGLCGGTCVAKAIASHGTALAVDPVECALTRYLYPELLEEFDSEGQRPLFQYYQKHRFADAANPLSL